MADMNMVRVSILSCQCCVPKDTSNEVAEEYVNTQNPTGIDSKWRIDESLGRTQCEKFPENVHLVLHC